ncbi:MAG TPA: hypothetical protein VLC08_16535, partial [Chitinolyticbacter sp.]|nr:hypothetical protein [Chitinolyticbacter sp.]
MARMISTSTYTAPSQAATIKALQQRAEEHANAAAKAAQMRQIGSPWQGAAQLMEVFSNNFNAGRAERQEAEGRQKFAQLLSGVDPTGGATPEQIQQMYTLDPDQGSLYAADAMKVVRDRQAAEAARQREDALALQKHNQALEIEREKARLAGEAGPKLTDISAVRQDVISDPSYKNLAQAAPIWSSITDAASRNTPQSDLNIIIGMAKLFDPTSVVREGETETVRQTANLPDNVWAQWQYLTANPNSRLSDDVKFGLLEEGASRMRGYQDAYKQTSDFYTNLGKRHRIDPGDI